MYGVDASNMADRAQALVVANGKSDVITIIKGKVEDIDLPEQVTCSPKRTKCLNVLTIVVAG